MTPDMPPEMWDHVLGLMYADKDALANSGLVCRAWARMSRLHLFHTITLEAYDTSDNNEQVLQILGRGDGSLASYVRHLTVLRSVSKDEQDHNNIFEKLSPFSNLEAVSLSYAMFFDWTAPAQECFMLSLHGVTDLTILGSFFKKPAQIITLVSRAIHLRKLAISGSVIGQSEEDLNDKILLAIDALPRPQLNSLYFNMVNGVECLIDWLHARPTISTLTIGDSDFLQWGPAMSRYLIAAGPSLKRMNVRMASRHIQIYVQFIDLSRSTNLRTITFGSPGPNGVLSTDIIAIMRMISAESIIEAINIGLVLRDERDILGSDFRKLGSFLTESSLSKTCWQRTIVRFLVQGPVKLEEIARLLRFYLHGLNKEGRLEIAMDSVTPSLH